MEKEKENTTQDQQRENENTREQPQRSSAFNEQSTKDQKSTRNIEEEAGREQEKTMDNRQ
jgi:hypothetical protein